MDSVASRITEWSKSVIYNKNASNVLISTGFVRRFMQYFPVDLSLLKRVHIMLMLL